MQDEWFYRKDGEEMGPVSTDDLKSLLESEVLSSNIPVKASGEHEWKPVTQVPELHEENEDFAVCAISGTRHPKTELLPFDDKWVLPDEKAVLVQKLTESGEASVSKSQLSSAMVLKFRGVWKLSLFARGAIALNLSSILTCLCALNIDPFVVDQFPRFLQEALINSPTSVLLTGMLSAVFFCAWKRRSVANAVSYEPRVMLTSPAASVGFYFVPIASFFKPFESMAQLRDSLFCNGQREGRMLLLRTWWLSWTAFQLFLIVAFQFSPLLEADRSDSNVGISAAFGWMAIACNFLSGILLIRIITKVTAKQIELSPSAR